MMFRLMLVILVLHLGRTGADMTVCPRSGFSSWYKVGCICVKYFTQEAKFDDAEMSCRGEGSDSHLISIHDDETSEAIRLLTGSTRVWIGGQKLTDGGFTWTDGSTWDYTNWVSGQPSGNGDCVQINWNTPGKWDDVECWLTQRYICAFEI